MASTNRPGIDIFKVLMALVVVMIHTSGVSFDIYKVAVPYFFLASGFFFFRNWEEDGKEAFLKEKKWLVRIAVMYFVWTIIYLPFTLYGFHQDKISAGLSAAVFLRNMLCVGENYLSWPLWYLLAAFWAGATFIILHRLRVPLWGVAVVSTTLYVMANSLNINQLHWHQSIFKSENYGILMAFCFMGTGGLLGTFLDKIPNRVKLSGALAVTVVSLVFVHWLWPLAAISLFVLSEGLQIPRISNETGRVFRDISTFVFLVHMIFAGLAHLLFGFGKSWPFCLLVAAVSLSVSFLLARYGGKCGMSGLLLGKL